MIIAYIYYLPLSVCGDIKVNFLSSVMSFRNYDNDGFQDNA